MSARCNSWTAEEDAMLKRLYLAEGKVIREVAIELNRTPSSVANRINTIGAIKTGPRKRWTKEEKEILRKYFDEGKTDQEIGDIVGRDALAIKTQRRYTRMLKQDCTRWDKKATETMLSLYKEKVPKGEIAKILGVDVKRVTYKLKRMGIISRKRSEKWTKQESENLIALLDSGISLEEISEKMNRPHEGIIAKCKYLRIAHKYDSLRRFVNAKINVKINSLDERIKHIIRNARSRSNIKGKDFNLTLEGVKQIYSDQNGQCFYSGLPLSFKTNDPSLLSIDRVNSDLGYVFGNVVLTTWACNAMKQDLDMETFLATAKLIALKANKIRADLKEQSLRHQPPPPLPASAHLPP